MLTRFDTGLRLTVWPVTLGTKTGIIYLTLDTSDSQVMQADLFMIVFDE